MTYTCPVCGFDGLNEKPYDEVWLGNEEFCECCGFFFETLSEEEEDGRLFDAWRKKWIAEGTRWDVLGSTEPPEGWNPKKQLLNIGVKI